MSENDLIGFIFMLLLALAVSILINIMIIIDFNKCTYYDSQLVDAGVAKYVVIDNSGNVKCELISPNNSIKVEENIE